MTEILLKTLSFVSILIIAKVLILSILDIFKINYPLKSFVRKYQMYYLFFITIIGTLGSIYLSTILALPVCNLCWHQRMFLFPLPVLALIALIKKDFGARIYIFYFAIIGFLFALYHSILQSGLLAKDAVFCNPGSLVVDCSIPYFTYFGFVTIPVIALAVFALIIYVAYPSNQK